MMINLLSVFIFFGTSLIHPFHVSVCDIDFSEESKSIQLSQRVFLDDFEEALTAKYGISLIIDDKSTIALRDSLIKLYLFENIQIRVEGEVTQKVFIGTEIEDDAIWCYVEFEGIKEISSLQITSSLLLETFDDQVNIIHFSYKNYEKSIRLDKLKTTGRFTPNE